MADLPVPRSYSQILGQQQRTTLSLSGLKTFKAGNPILSFLEAASRSDLRSSQDIFGLLNAIDPTKARGLALEEYGNSKRIPKILETAASGFVTIGDASFEKVSTTIYQGQAAPIIGSGTLYVVDASSFTGAVVGSNPGPATSGELYIGRGTANYEGPLTYNRIDDLGSYWAIQLASGSETSNFHNLGESVILAQGGNRTIGTNVLVKTPESSTSQSIVFSVRFPVVIPDGETSISNVAVIAQLPGTSGNVGALAISKFQAEPFSGATVYNPTSFSNGLDTERDEDYSARIIQVEASRARGIESAITSSVIGVLSNDENKRISSATLMREDGVSTLYIDDGTGYEERIIGVPFETLTESAFGGEQYFAVQSQRPIAKAHISSQAFEPFTLSSGAKLAVEVGGVLYEHSFSEEDFISISNASAYEVVASINANPEASFSARTSEEGIQVILFSRSETNDDILVTSVSSGTDANDSLMFPKDVTFDTIKLYKNDRLLFKDGQSASVSSKQQSEWSSTIASGETLEMYVDGTPLPGLVTFNDVDFINAGTDYSTVLFNNSLDSWATVINSKIPGITAVAEAGGLKLTSNKAGNSSKIEIVSGSLITKGVFTVDVSTGHASDYSLNRNLGHIRLDTALSSGDKLTIGSSNTRGFLESSEWTNVTTASDSELWFCVDGNVTLVPSPAAPGIEIDYTVSSTESWGKAVNLNSVGLFENAQADDFIVIADDNVSADNRGAFRLAMIVDDDNAIIELPSSWTATGTEVLSEGDVSIVRSSSVPQKIVLAAGSYTPTNVADAINAELVGGTASVFKSRFLRVRTNTYTNGQIALVAQNQLAADSFLMELAVEDNTDSHIATLSSSNTEVGTPWFGIPTPVSAVATGTSIDFPFDHGHDSQMIAFTRPFFDGTQTRGGSLGFHSPTEVAYGTYGFTLRKDPIQPLLADATDSLGDSAYFASPFALSPEDKVGFIIDGDVDTHRYIVPTYRKVTPVNPTFSTTNTFVDADNGSVSLAQAFGVGFDWRDFAIYMKARVVTGALIDDDQILWRYYRHGGEGENVRLSFDYPTAADQSPTLEISGSNALDASKTSAIVRLASDSLRANTSILGNSKVGIAYILTSEKAYRTSYVFGYGAVSGAIVAGTPGTVTLTLIDASYTTATGITDHGLQVNDIIFFNSTDVNFITGTYTITARTATTISYAGPNVTVGATPNVGTVTFGPLGESRVPPAVVVGDIMTIQPGGTSVPSNDQQTLKLKGVGVQWVTGTTKRHATGLSVSTTPTFYPINDGTFFEFYPLSADNTADDIVTAIGTDGGLSATLIGTGSGLIDTAFYEFTADGGYRDGNGDYWMSLLDGIHHVRSTNTPVTPSTNFTFTMKKAPAGSFSNGWTSEDIRLVPITAKNVSDFMNSPAVGGLFGSSDVEVTSYQGGLQVTTSTIGSSGAVECQGGSANSLAAPIKGSASVHTDASQSIASVNITDGNAAGLRKDFWVKIQNTNKSTKPIFTALTEVTDMTSAGVFTVNVGNLWTFANVAAADITNRYWQVDVIGKFVRYAWSHNGTQPDLSGVKEGDWVNISGTSFNAFNRGLFKIVRIAYSATNYSEFWIENSLAVNQTITTAPSNTMRFVDANSILPGDSLEIITDVIGGNVGVWIVSDFGADEQSIQLSVVSNPIVTFSGSIVLGDDAALVRVIEANPVVAYKQITNIYPSGVTGLTSLKFDSSNGYEYFSESLGSIVSAMDKLSFPTATVTGSDGYSRSIGLIAEANRVLYGDPTDSVSYPGYVAYGDFINIAGVLIRRFSMSVSIRVRSGAVQDVTGAVRSAIASYINSQDHGTPIAFSGILAAIEEVQGVGAATILSPTYSSGNDLIPVSANEKLKVIDSEQDITVLIVGE